MTDDETLRRLYERNIGKSPGEFVDDLEEMSKDFTSENPWPRGAPIPFWVYQWMCQTIDHAKVEDEKLIGYCHGLMWQDLKRLLEICDRFGLESFISGISDYDPTTFRIEVSLGNR